MLDYRKIPKQHDEIDPLLNNLSDTEILLEFSKVLTMLYPSLTKLRSHCYDNYDFVSENLFYDLVYYTFSSKYGAIIDKNETHKYGFTLHTYRHIHHICIIPKSFPFSFTDSDGKIMLLTEADFNNKELVFILFGDKINNLSSDEEDLILNEVGFDFVNFAIVDKSKGLYFRNSDHYWVNKKLVGFEVVLEDYNVKEHENYKHKFAD
jgi:hypothetical protein